MTPEVPIYEPESPRDKAEAKKAAAHEKAHVKEKKLRMDVTKRRDIDKKLMPALGREKKGKKYVEIDKPSKEQKAKFREYKKEWIKWFKKNPQNYANVTRFHEYFLNNHVEKIDASKAGKKEFADSFSGLLQKELGPLAPELFKKAIEQHLDAVDRLMKYLKANPDTLGDADLNKLSRDDWQYLFKKAGVDELNLAVEEVERTAEQERVRRLGEQLLTNLESHFLNRGGQLDLFEKEDLPSDVEIAYQAYLDSYNDAHSAPKNASNIFELNQVLGDAHDNLVDLIQAYYPTRIEEADERELLS